jgi:hypothetical protein
LSKSDHRDCLEIRGIPTIIGENTNELVKKIGQQIGAHVSYQDISTSHRLRMSDGRDPAIIVKFSRRDVKPGSHDEISISKRNL